MCTHVWLFPRAGAIAPRAGPSVTHTLHFIISISIVLPAPEPTPPHTQTLAQMCADGGPDSVAAAQALASAGYTDLAVLEGGYAAYTEVGAGSGDVFRVPGHLCCRLCGCRPQAAPVSCSSPMPLPVHLPIHSHA